MTAIYKEHAIKLWLTKLTFAINFFPYFLWLALWQTKLNYINIYNGRKNYLYTVILCIHQPYLLNTKVLDLIGEIILILYRCLRSVLELR